MESSPRFFQPQVGTLEDFSAFAVSSTEKHRGEFIEDQIFRDDELILDNLRRSAKYHQPGSPYKIERHRRMIAEFIASVLSDYAGSKRIDCRSCGYPCRCYEFPVHVLEQAMAYVDRFCECKGKVSPASLQLLACASLMVACKARDHWAPTPNQLALYTNLGNSPQEIREFEKDLLRAMDFFTVTVIPSDFVTPLAERSNSASLILEHLDDVYHYLSAVAMDQNCRKFCPAKLAVSAILHVVELHHPNTAESFTGVLCAVAELEEDSLRTSHQEVEEIAARSMDTTTQRIVCKAAGPQLSLTKYVKKHRNGKNKSQGGSLQSG